MNTYKLIISTPDGNPFDSEAFMLSVRGVEGELAVMAGHIPFVTSLVPSECKILLEDETEICSHITGGLLTGGNKETTLIAGSFKVTE